MPCTVVDELIQRCTETEPFCSPGFCSQWMKHEVNKQTSKPLARYQALVSATKSEEGNKNKGVYHLSKGLGEDLST